MKLSLWIGYMGCAIGVAHAEQVKESPVDLGAMEIVATQEEEAEADAKKKAPASHYESYDPVDSGASVIGRETVETSKEGGIDTTSLLESLPFVQMDTERQSADPESIQSIRPSDFSISGGNYYDNNIKIDGVTATSIMDVSSQSREDFNEVFGQTSQTLYVDPSLIEQVNVFDSNVSARYGDFTGGVVDYQLRQPARKFGVRASAGIQNDSMVKYHQGKASDDTDTQEGPPDFTKYQTTLSVDMPLTDKLFTLASITRTESSVQYQMAEDYGAQQHKSGDTSDNYFLKSRYEYSPELTLEGQFIYSPYRSEQQPDNSINSLNINHSDGLSSYLALNGITDESHWQHKVSYQESDASRTWPGDRYSWSSKADSINWCSDNNCAEGGFGDLDQWQRDSTYDFSMTRPLGAGELSLGSELKLTEARKRRPEDNYYYSTSKLMNSGVTAACAEDDLACKEDVVLSQRSDYNAYDAEVDIFSQALWSEYFQQIGDWGLRAGARMSHDDFLDNYNTAPRLSANWEFMPQWFLTMGANRYYSANMLGYAIRSQYPDSYIYRRTVNTSTGAVGDWQLFSQSRATDYRQAGLDTPYSDELSAALTVPTPMKGNARIKAVYRQNRDGFASTDKQKEVSEADTGKTYTTTVYNLTNDGKSDYKGLALEWSGQHENHSFNANVTWSRTRSYGVGNTYFDYTDPGEQIYYQGQLISMDELYEQNTRSNYAAPIRASIGWAAMWFVDKLMTNATVNYRGAYDYLGDTDDDIEIDGTNYDVYAEQTLKSFTTLNMNTRYQLFRYMNQSASVDMRVTNVFNSFPETQSSSSSSYLLGRSWWLGVNYVY